MEEKEGESRRGKIEWTIALHASLFTHMVRRKRNRQEVQGPLVPIQLALPCPPSRIPGNRPQLAHDRSHDLHSSRPCHRKSSIQCCAAAARAASGQGTKKAGRSHGKQRWSERRPEAPQQEESSCGVSAAAHMASAMTVHFFLAAALVTLPPTESFFSTCAAMRREA